VDAVTGVPCFLPRVKLSRSDIKFYACSMGLHVASISAQHCWKFTVVTLLAIAKFIVM